MTSLIGLMKRFAEACHGVVVVDAKTLRHSFDAPRRPARCIW